MRKFKPIDWSKETEQNGAPHVLSSSKITGAKEINIKDCPYSKAVDLLRAASAYADA